MDNRYVIEINNLRKVYTSGYFRKKHVVGLDGMSVRIESGKPKIIAIAGESGSGKTTFANLVLDFIRPTSGEICYRGVSIEDFTKEQRVAHRREIQAVFQDPYDSFNPFYKIHHVFQLIHEKLYPHESRTDFYQRITEAFAIVGLRVEDIWNKHPHQLSGGQRQRVMIARACAAKPSIVVADEPVSAVDATIRGMILTIMLEMRERGISFFYITHDLSTAYQVADDIYLLYKGRVVERGGAQSVISEPRHPYSKLLIDSVPVPDPRERWQGTISLPNDEVNLGEDCCKFHPRCRSASDECRTRRPGTYNVNGTEVACFLYKQYGTEETQ